MAVTGRKETDKLYYWHTGYVGGIKQATFKEMIARRPEAVIEIAVKGMLPKGPLGRAMFRKLKVYAGAEHQHAAQPVSYTHLANRVKARLIQDGVTSEITAVGYGKVPQVKACNGYKHASKAEKDCLRPNRRVEITASGSVLKLQEGGQVNGGTQGPAPLYQK